ncbi:MAG: hypothetical protein ACKOSR_12880, partial [Flavobacteriales bacterium]
MKKWSMLCVNRIYSHIALLLCCFAMGLHAWAQPEWVENKGQWPAQVAYQTRLAAGTIWTEYAGFTYQLFNGGELAQLHNTHSASENELLHGHNYRVRFVNGAAQSAIGESKQSHYYNYYTSSNPQAQGVHCGVYSRTRLVGIYPGIDIQLYSASGKLKYDWVVAPGAEPTDIELSYEGANLSLVHRERGTELLVETSVQTIIVKQPFAYQLIDGKMQEVRCEYVLENNHVRFRLGKYNRSLPLVIDPEIAFSTYIGSPANSWGFTACDDSQGNLIAGSAVFAPNYPTTTGAFSVTFNSAAGNYFDAAITKFSSDGSQLLYSTYLGGELQETPHSVVVDSQDKIIVFGVTGSADFPATSGVYQQTFTGGPFQSMSGFFSGQHPNGTDLFITKFNTDGSLFASTFLGGTDNDGLNNADQLFYNYGDAFRGEVNVDAADNVYIATVTRSTDFPVTSGSFGGGDFDGVLCKLNPSLSNLMQ